MPQPPLPRQQHVAKKRVLNNAPRYLYGSAGDLWAEAEIQHRQARHAGAQVLDDFIRNGLVPGEAKLFQAFESGQPLGLLRDEESLAEAFGISKWPTTSMRQGATLTFLGVVDRFNFTAAGVLQKRGFDHAPIAATHRLAVSGRTGKLDPGVL